METEKVKKPKVVILNITHGDNPYMDQPPFLPIAAGACRSDITNDACGEDNISAKNKWYGDFTSLYWAWKNLKNVDIIGTSQYRRYLVDDNLLGESDEEYSISWDGFVRRRYQVKSLIRLLEKCDFVMLDNLQLGLETVREQYIRCHPYPDNIEKVTEALQRIHPESVVIWEQMLEERTLQRGYLFLTRWEKFEELCEWLYPVLVEFEKLIDLSKYDGYQCRVVAFIYERLVSVFIKSKGYRIEYRAMYFIEPASNKKVSDYQRECRRKRIKQSSIYQTIRAIYRKLNIFTTYNKDGNINTDESYVQPLN